MKGLRRAAGRPQVGLVELIAQFAQAISIVPAGVMQTTGQGRGQPIVVAFHDQLDMLEAHIGPHPVLAHVRFGVLAFGAAGPAEGMVGGKMGLADEAGPVARGGKAARKPGFSQLLVQVDAVVAHAMRQRKQSCQYRGPGGLAYQVRGDAGRKVRPAAGELVNMRRLDTAACKAQAVAAMLIRGDEQDVGTFHLVYLVCCLSLAMMGAVRSVSAMMRAFKACAPPSPAERPCASSLALICGVSRTAWTLSSSCCRMLAGVPAGANRPNQLS